MGHQDILIKAIRVMTTLSPSCQNKNLMMMPRPNEPLCWQRIKKNKTGSMQKHPERSVIYADETYCAAIR